MNTILYVRAGEIYNDSRATKEIMAFIESGYYVHVLGWDRSGGAAQKCEDCFKDCCDFMQWDFYVYRATSGLGLSDMNAILGWFSFVRHKIGVIKPFVIHACDLIAGYPVKKYAKMAKTHFTYDIFDHFADSHNLTKPLDYIARRFEISVINSADVVIICTDERRVQLKGSNPQKIVVIHNSPEVDQLTPTETIDYAYCGTFSTDRLVQEIIENYQYNQDLKFVYAGGGVLQDTVQYCADNNENFSYLGQLEYKKVLELEATCKCISAIYNPAIKNNQLCAPNKFYEALALGKPLIVCRGTGIDKIVEEKNIGVVIDYSSNQFYEAVHYLCNNDALRKDMGMRGRLLYELNYQWSIMKKRLIDTYRNYL